MLLIELVLKILSTFPDNIGYHLALGSRRRQLFLLRSRDGNQDRRMEHQSAAIRRSASWNRGVDRHQFQLNGPMSELRHRGATAADSALLRNLEPQLPSKKGSQWKQVDGLVELHFVMKMSIVHSFSSNSSASLSMTVMASSGHDRDRPPGHRRTSRSSTSPFIDDLKSPFSTVGYRDRNHYISLINPHNLSRCHGSFSVVILIIQ